MRPLKFSALLLISLMIMPMFPVQISYNLDKLDSAQNYLLEEPEDFLKPDWNEKRVESFVGERKLILFKSQNLMEEALNQIDSENVKYVFKYIPAFIAGKSIDASKLMGVTKAIPSSLTFFQNQNDPWKSADNLRNEVAFNTLEETKDWISIEPLWNKGLFGQNQSIAIIDSGINRTLAFSDINNLTKTRGEFFSIGSLDEGESSTYDFSGHGTHVAGIAVGNGMYNLNGKYRLFKSRGMAPEANFKSIRVLNEYGAGDNLDVLAGIDFAISLNVSVISMSLGSDNYNGTADLFVRLMQKVAENDILAVVAAGNLGNFGGSTIGIPGALETVLSVGALENPNKIWSQSSRGPSVPPSFLNKPDVVAPGVNIISVNAKDGSPAKETGTSMSVPHVSGGSLLLRQAFPNATAVDIKQAILGSAIDLKEEVEVQGRGLVNFTKAYEILEAKFKNTENNILLAASVNPVAIHDGQEYDSSGLLVRKSSNSYFRSSLINETRSFNITIFSNTNITLIPKFENQLGKVEFGLPDIFKLSKGVNRLQINVTVRSSGVEYVKATVYFFEAQSLQIMQFTNISFFALAKFQKGKILFDASKDADTLGDFFLNDRPEGKFSALSNLLRNKGFVVNYTNKTLTSGLLDQYDVLVLPDPDLPYSGDEIQAIRDFVDNKGGGILILGSGGTYITEAGSMGEFSIDTLNTLLRLDNGDGEIHIRYETPSNGFSSVEKISLGLTDRVQKIIPPLVQIPFYGPYLTTTSDQAQILATYGNKPILVADEVGRGRVVVSSSLVPFTFQSLSTNLYGSEEINKKIAFNIIEWLAESRGIRTEIFIDEEKLNVDKSTQVRLYDSIPVSFSLPTTPNGSKLDLPAVIEAYIIHYDPPNFISSLNFTLTDGIYKADFELYFYGEYELNIPIITEDVKSSISIGLFAFLENYEDQKLHDTVAITFLWLLFFSWLLWLRNEGGRELRRKLKSL